MFETIIVWGVLSDMYKFFELHYQENIPSQTAEKVKTSMLEGVEAALGLPKGSLPRPIYSRVQLW